MNERWKPIEGYEGLYEISSLGRIKCIPHKVPTKFGAMRTTPAMIKGVRPVAGRGVKYCIVSLSKHGIKKTFYVHRLVLQTFVGAAPPGTECCHNNGNPTDNRLENLRWDTKAANGADRERHGRGFKGARNPNARLTPKDVEIIRYLSSERGACAAELARVFGVRRQQIAMIIDRKSWVA